jgi:hypothetical protein
MTARTPRYRAYAASHGRDTESMLAADRAAWPGGLMCGFMIWNSQHWREWERATGWRGTGKSQADHDAYDAWLARRYLPAEEAAAA